ncbi:hypothetical protein CMUS01_05081 [Colletotrichum musicola]|uniref:RRM domain-containing protein n=1 Tax=Colletotrichum musicola TaxID=2175873 RepID=A0A8H6KUN2_9PEZI|nr:hypothetical protein CMUS01_05081 [Colletotrichum musicola]
MMATNTYPGFFPGAAEKRQDDDGSVNYATTDDGWTHDEESNAGERPAAPANISPASASSVLIDFSDAGDAGHSERNLGDNTLNNHTSDRDLLDGSEMALSPGPSLDSHTHSSLNPESPPFSPSSTSSYADARQSLDSSDDEIASFEARIKELENGHETLKRSNDNLDTVNEMMKHQLEEHESHVEKLKGQLAESEHLRTRAQKTAVDFSEKNEKLTLSLDELKRDREEFEPQIAEYKNKLAGALSSNRPLHDSLNDMQSRLLNTVHHIKEIEAFARSFLTDHPEHTGVFASVGLFPPGEGQQYDSSGQIEAEALISFDEPILDLPTPQSQDAIPPESGTPAHKDCSSPQTPQVPVNYLDDDVPVQHDAINQPLMDAQSNTSNPSNAVTAPTGLNWTPASACLYESEFDKERAIRSHQGPRPVGRVPGMFIHGIRFVRQHTEQKLTREDDIPDVASRHVIMSDLPDDVHVQRVLEHVRGGRVLKAQLLTVKHDGGCRNMAYVEFADAGDAIEFYRFTRRREFGFFVNDRAVRAHIELPGTDSYPLSDGLQPKLRLSRNYADVVTHFALCEDGRFEISFADIKTAITVRDCILRSKFYGGDRRGDGVLFRSDPCDAPLDGLQVPFLPIESTSDVSILDPEHARRFMTDEERALDSERLLEEIAAAADPDDPDTFHPQDQRKNIIWEKFVIWDDIPIYMAYEPGQRRQVPHQRDPASGAVRHQYHGGWTMSLDESRRMWLHYNHDSPHPWTQQTADLWYAATGDIDIRKKPIVQKQIVVDDGGLDGDADQAMSNVDHGYQARDERSSTWASMSAAPLFSHDSRNSASFANPSKDVPTGGYINTIDFHHGPPVPSLQEHDLLTDRAPASTSTVPPHLWGGKRGPGSCFGFFTASAVGREVGIHGITKPGFNKLAAKIAKDKGQVASKAPKEQKPFW